VCSSDLDIPVIDLIDLTLDQFNSILKLLPKDNVWLKARREKSTFFDNIASDLNKISEMVDKFDTIRLKYNELSQKREQPTTKLEELQALSEIIKNDKMNTIPQKFCVMTTTINTFTSNYNSSGVLKYRGKTLTQPSSLVNDLLNSEFISFLHTFKGQHKKLLIDSIKNKLPPSDNEVSNKLNATYSYMRQFTTKRRNLNAYNRILELLALYKNVQYISLYEASDPQVQPRIGAINQYIAAATSNKDIVAKAMAYLQTPRESTTLIKDIKVEILRMQGAFQPPIRDSGVAVEAFNYLYPLLNNKNNPQYTRIKDTLTVLTALLPIEYADRLQEFSNVVQYFEVYGTQQAK